MNSNMSKKIFETESRMSRKEVSKYLRKIADEIEKGSVKLDSGSQSIELKPSENLEFEVEVEEEGKNETSLELEIEWDEDEERSGLEIG